MKTIAEFDFKNYDNEWSVFSRKAVRVIIINDGKIAMIRSKRGYYKFPGGGKRAFESDAQTAKRETLEETGLTLIDRSLKAFGAVVEIRKSNRHAEEIFKQTSFYYTADAEDTLLPQRLDIYEASEGYALEWVDIERAYDVNLEYIEAKKCLFLKREMFVLEMLKNSL